MFQTKIPLETFKKLAPAFVQAEEIINYKSGQNIFYEGHKPYGVHVIRKGRVVLFKTVDGIEVTCRIEEPGAVLGAEEVANQRSYEYGARAVTDVSARFFGSVYFEPESSEDENRKEHSPFNERLNNDAD